MASQRRWFDHLNQSSAAWALGAPSVVPLFAKGIQHVRHRMYAEELEDFAASNNHAALDEWVFDRTIEILDGRSLSAEDEANGRSRDTERAALEGERVVFLLHLLGLDSAGHAHKPFGDAYAQNVKTVDNGVRRLVDAFERRFDQTPRDGGTTFLFTADHGMSSRGAHGDGDPGCTETPFVAWGAGIPAAADAGRTRVRAPGRTANAARPVGPRDKEVTWIRRTSRPARPSGTRRRRTTPDRCLCRTSTRRPSARSSPRRQRRQPWRWPAQGGGRRCL